MVLGVAASIIAVGWLCLFVYYNSCGRPYATTIGKPLIHTISLKDEFIQTAENDSGDKYFDVQPLDTESNKNKSLKTISSENGSSSRMQKAVKDASMKERRGDLRIHKLESRGDKSVPTMKEICVEEKPHPHPIPPTASGILEVRSFTEQMYRNPMNCL